MVSPKSNDAQPAALRLGTFISNVARARFMHPVAASATKRALLDCVAATLSGAREPVVEHAKSLHSGKLPAQAVVIGGGGLRLPLDAAAMVNGTMGHATDYDDVSPTMWGHATAPVLPTVLALGEQFDLSGAQFLNAFLIGLEVEMKLGAAVAPHHYGLGWHPTSTIGVFGACAGAAAVASLSASQCAAALCIAASRAAGLRANFGSMTKPLHVGFAARDGLEAAMLAARDVTGQMTALDGAFGFVETMARGKGDLENCLARLGNPFSIVTPGLAYKYYPSCSDTHIAVDALLDLTEAEKIALPAIERVRCSVTKSVFDNLIYSSPKSGLEGKFSMQFCLARALEKRRLTLEDFTDASVHAAGTCALMKKIDMEVDCSIREGDYCSPAKIEVFLKDGRAMSRVAQSARGHADRPLDDTQLKEKFDACAKIALSEKGAQRLYEMIREIEKLPSIGPLAIELSGRNGD